MNRCRSLYKFAQIKTLVLALLLFPVPSTVLHAQSPAKDSRKVLQRVEPEFPDFFRNGHFQGRVVAQATVLPSGTVSRVEIKSGNPMFAEFATKALMKWKYAPAPEKTVEEVTFNFNSVR